MRMPPDKGIRPLTRLVQATCVWLLWALLTTSQITATAPPEASHKLALIIGHNKGNHELKALQFAQQDAKRLAATLQELGGYRADQIHLLLSPTRQQLQATMRKIQQKVATFHKKGVFFFYYSGHAQGDQFQLGEEQISFRRLWKFIKALPVRVRVLLIDSCFAGRFLNAKGPQRLSSIQWVPPEERENQGVAMLASSGANGRSYESTQIKGSLFTSSVLAGLRGAADKNGDQQISLAELWQYVYSRTLTDSGEIHKTIQRPAHRIELRGQGPLILSILSKRTAQLVFPKAMVGHIFVYRDQTLFQDIHKGAKRNLHIGLQPGQYQLRIRRDDKIGVYNHRLASREQHRVQMSQIQWRSITASDQAKGAEGAYGSTNLALLLHYQPMNYLAAHGLGMSLAIDSGRWLRAGLGYSYGLSTPLGISYQTHTLQLRLGVGYGGRWDAFDLWFGAMLEPLLVIRQYPTKQHWNMGLNAGGLGLLDIHIRSGWSMRIALSGGINAMLFPNNALLTAPHLDLALGLVWTP